MNHYNNEKNGPPPDKAGVVVASIRSIFDIIFAPTKAVTPDETTQDLTVSFITVIIIGSTFLLFWNYLPLFSSPGIEISLHETYLRTSEYMATHSLWSLAGKYWTSILITAIGWVCIIFGVHNRNKEDQSYMLSVTMKLLCVILGYIIIRYMGLLGLIKLEQIFGIVNRLNKHYLLTLPLSEWLFFIALLPILFMVIQSVQEIGKRALTTSLLFCLMLVGVYKITRYYTAPLGNKIQHSTIPVKDKKKGTGDLIIIASGIAGGAAVHFRTKYAREKYIVNTSIEITNNSDVALKLPYYKSLRVNLQADSIALLQQSDERTNDFVFDILSGSKLKHVTIAAHCSKTVQLSGEISAITYDYLLRYLRNNEVAKYKVKFIVALDNKHQTVDVVESCLWSMRFANGEEYGIQPM